MMESALNQVTLRRLKNGHKSRYSQRWGTELFAANCLILSEWGRVMVKKGSDILAVLKLKTDNQHKTNIEEIK